MWWWGEDVTLYGSAIRPFVSYNHITSGLASILPVRDSCYQSSEVVYKVVANLTKQNFYETLFVTSLSAAIFIVDYTSCGVFH